MEWNPKFNARFLSFFDVEGILIPDFSCVQKSVTVIKADKNPNYTTKNKSNECK